VVVGRYKLASLMAAYWYTKHWTTKTIKPTFPSF
jgi:hypothetical protein